MPLPSWPDTAPLLIDVAMGRAPADTLIRNGRWVNVHSGEIIPGTDIAIKAGRFAAIGPDLGYTQGPQTVAQQRPVVSGVIENGFVEIKEGLASGQRIVADGLNRIQPGMPVSIGGAPGPNGRGAGVSAGQSAGPPGPGAKRP